MLLIMSLQVEEAIARVPRPFSTETLLGPELRVPQHEPSASPFQPRDATAVNKEASLFTTGTSALGVSECQIVELDSFPNSLRRENGGVEASRPRAKITTATTSKNDSVTGESW